MVRKDEGVSRREEDNGIWETPLGESRDHAAPTADGGRRPYEGGCARDW